MKTKKALNLDDLMHDWSGGRFIMNSGYYAGRPPGTGDLNSRDLERIFLGIKRDIGETEAKNFVRFVNKLKDFSASSFIVALEKFWAKKCLDVSVSQSEGDRTRITDHGSGAHDQAFSVVAHGLAGIRTSEEEIVRLSDDLKRPFIIEHLQDIPSEEMGETPLVGESDIPERFR